MKNKKVWWIIGIVVVFLLVLLSIKVQNTPADFLPSVGESITQNLMAPTVATREEAAFEKVSSSTFALSLDSDLYDMAGSTAAEVDQKIIKTGYLDLAVDSVNEAVVKITALAAGRQGYLQSSSVYEREDGTKYGSLTVRVPAEDFESTITEIKDLATAVTSETSSGQDVTERYTDLEARLHSAQAQETEYLEILTKAESVDDILSVQSYLGQVRAEIESLQGQINYLENQTNYSTISVSLSEEASVRIPTKEFRPWSTIKEAAQALVALFQNIIVAAIWLIIVLGGLLLPFVVIVWLIYWLVKRKIKNSNQRTRK